MGLWGVLEYNYRCLKSPVGLVGGGGVRLEDPLDATPLLIA